MKKAADNPFRPGNGLAPPYLAGRGREILGFERALKTAISLPQNSVVSGLRGTGKTVLLLEFEKICARSKWLHIRREFNPRLNDINQFLFTVLSDLLMKAQGTSVLRKARKRRIGFLPSAETVINGSFIERLLSSHLGTMEDRLEAILEEVYSEIIESDYKGLVWLFDEFHTIEDEKIRGHFPLSMLLEVISHLQQKGCRYFLILSGLPSLFPNLVRAKTYSERMFTVNRVGRLDRSDAKLAIEKPLENTPHEFESRLVDTLVKETDGYPYFLQLYSFLLIDNVPRDRISHRDFLKMRPFILNRLDESFFAGRFEWTSNSERELLFKMTELNDEIETSSLRKSSKKSRGAINLILTRLMEKGIIYRVRRGAYSFTLPLFKEFLKRQLV